MPHKTFKGRQASDEISPFLVGTQVAGVSMTVAVMSNFVACGEDRLDGVRKGFGSVTGDKERRQDPIG